MTGIVNAEYLRSVSCIIKFLQIGAGLLIVVLLCTNAYSGSKHCFAGTPMFFASGLNFAALAINIFVFLCYFENVARRAPNWPPNWPPIGLQKLERTYLVLAAILFLAATLVSIWFIIEYSASHIGLVISAALTFIEFLLCLWDLGIMLGGTRY